MSEDREPTLEETLAEAFVKSARPNAHFAAGVMPAAIELSARELRERVIALLTDYPAAVQRHAKARADREAAAAKQAEAAARRRGREQFIKDYPSRPVPAHLLDPEPPEGGQN